VSLGHLRRRPLPPALAQELGALWAEILVAEYHRRREVTRGTVESPAGLNRREGDGVEARAGAVGSSHRASPAQQVRKKLNLTRREP
jgi:hypothetical protein